MGHGCHRRELATGHSCRVERCSCGTLHVSLGALTLRLEAAVVADTVATLERALAELDSNSARGLEGERASAPPLAPPPPHDPDERELAQTFDDWEVRVFADAKFGFFVERGLWHVQLWHRRARVSVLTPSRLTGGAYEMFPSAGWKRRVASHGDVARIVREEHGVSFIEEEALRHIERVFVMAPIAFAAAPEGAS